MNMMIEKIKYDTDEMRKEKKKERKRRAAKSLEDI